MPHKFKASSGISFLLLSGFVFIFHRRPGARRTGRHLIDTSEESGLVFRPLEPALETTLYIAWNRYQTFTPIAERFLQQLKDSFGDAVKQM